MPPTRAVVIPFGVPEDGQGLGLGLAALLHGFARIEAHSVGLAQLQVREAGNDATERAAAKARGGAVEAMISAAVWREMTAGEGASAPANVTLVVTGAFDPPNAGRGLIQLLAFDPRDGAIRAKVESLLDGDRAGAGVVGAFEELCATLGGELGLARELRHLGWDSLESVIRAERCALHDPSLGRPHDRLAAMLHLGRAVGDAPEATFPATRLASLAIQTALGEPGNEKLAHAALRALERAAVDAPTNGDLIEALSLLEIRLGRPRAAERRLNAAIAEAPSRARLYALLSEALRTLGDLDGALSAVHAGLAESPDVTLTMERGAVLARRGDLGGAGEAWREVLASDPRNPAAFANLAALAQRQQDGTAAQALVDHALAAHGGIALDTLRRAIELALMTEADDIARASRIATLTRAILDAAPEDAWASLVLARAHVRLGESREAIARLRDVEAFAPGTPLAAEALRARFSLEEPKAALEVEAVLRAAIMVAGSDLDDVAARARRLAILHGGWPAWLAATIAERRAGRWEAARFAAEAALQVAPGSPPVHAELVTILLALRNPSGALRHAKQLLALEGENAKTLTLLARAMHASGDGAGARIVIGKALAQNPADEAALHLLKELATAPEDAGLRTRLRRAFSRWRS